MLTAITMATALTAIFAAGLLVYASFEHPALNSGLQVQGRTEQMRSIRQLGLRSAIIALIGTYLVVFLT